MVAEPRSPRGSLEKPMEGLPLVEIVPKGGVYDYGARYTAGATDYYAPARLDAIVADAVRGAAGAAVAALGTRGLGRVDILVADDGAPSVLEVNVSPGMTETSSLPMAAQAAGISFDQLCDATDTPRGRSRVRVRLPLVVAILAIVTASCTADATTTTGAGPTPSTSHAASADRLGARTDPTTSNVCPWRRRWSTSSSLILRVSRSSAPSRDSGIVRPLPSWRTMRRGAGLGAGARLKV